ncbi:acyltransferase family protein, partial [Rhizobium leucaenae]
PTPPPLSTFPEILFPWNGPAWSLFFELLINFAYGLVAVKLSGRALTAAIIGAAFFLVVASLHFGTLEGGATWATYPVGFPRVIFSFSLGIVIKRYWMRPVQQSRIGPWLLSVLCIAVLVFDPGDALRPYYNLFVIILLWPLVVIMASRMSFARGWRIVSQLSGDASYGIYVLHTPLLNLFVLITEWDSGAKWSGHGLRFAILSLGTAMIVSCWLSYVYDRPIRHRLMQIFPRKIDIAPAPTA